MKIGLSSLNETPIFTAEDPTASGSRVFGGTLDRSKTHWRFPAFPPFVERVLHDLDKVYKPLTFSSEAETWINMLKPEEEWVEYAGQVACTLPLGCR